MPTTGKPTPSWRDVLPVHPAADLFPLMTANELRKLGEDLRKNGLRTAVAVFKEQKHFPPALLDGRNRLDAIEAAGIAINVESCGTDADPRIQFSCRAFPIDTIEIRGDQPLGDPYAYVVSANIHRRHLTAEQKRELLAKVLKATPEKSDRQIAETAKTDHKTVASVRAEQEARGEIPHVSTRTDSKGRQQPARKPSERKSREEIAAYEAGRLLGCLERASDAVQRNFIQYLPAEILVHRDDIGTASNGEIARKDARIEELEHENRRLQLENIALRSEIEELKTQLLDIPGFLDRTKEAAS